MTARAAPATEVRRLDAGEARRRIGEVAALRRIVFREWPYLYDGDDAYERRYLAAYLEAPGAVIIGAFADGRMVGAATASPLADHHDAFARPLREAGLDPAEHFYFGESVLLPAWRGGGTGVRFFAERERAARAQGFALTLFTSVIRPDGHPARPAGHVPLDGFWRRRGYERLPGITARFSWRDVGDSGETEKPMEFWRRQIA